MRSSISGQGKEHTDFRRERAGFILLNRFWPGAVVVVVLVVVGGSGSMW